MTRTMFVLGFLFSHAFSRASGHLYTSLQGTGDCFSDTCSFSEAMLTLRMADIVHIKDKIFYPTSYPSEFSDLIESSAHNNVTLIGTDDNTIIDGKFFNRWRSLLS